ncbi:hypothetical protein GCM10011514_00950 [Emticicia aquatilis]|uniref:HTH cro/C1-type domain-containing protein n=1 Tax=Emticicia aquatilis TaxID=1537369 RepID=A0A917DIK9_9BACT|nr:helix-turn-helix transcriptional regulator [Emticicia aquatilis]GGD40682.1 hypothetical protein GCM10011514_00950 [Emticicia aquatilis]
MKEEQKKQFYMLIGENIVRYMKQNNIKQSQLLEKLEDVKSRSTLSNILSGKRQISLHLLHDISIIINVNINLLIPSTNELYSVSDNFKLREALNDANIDDTKNLKSYLNDFINR